MAIIGENEVAVDNQMRRAERQNQSPVDRILESAESATNAISLTTGLAPIGGIAKAFGVARRFTSELGVATLSENLDHLGNATEAALSRVEKKLEARGVRVDEIYGLLNSGEFLEGIKAATLQAQRTKDKKRLERMALILANGVAENDLEPERLDDMMRAAAELSDRDISLLRELCEHPSPINMNEIDKGNADFEERMGSVAKLQAVAFAQLRTPGLDMGANIVAVLPRGKKFYERLQEISTEASS